MCIYQKLRVSEQRKERVGGRGVVRGGGLDGWVGRGGDELRANVCALCNSWWRWIVLQCCCSVMRFVAVCCSVLPCAASKRLCATQLVIDVVCGAVLLQCVAVCCEQTPLRYATPNWSDSCRSVASFCCCSVLQFFVVCCEQTPSHHTARDIRHGLTYIKALSINVCIYMCIYMYIYIYMYIHNLSHSDVYKSNINQYMYIYIYFLCIYIHNSSHSVYIHMYICISIHNSSHFDVCKSNINPCMYTYRYICIYIHMYIYVYV